MSLIIRPGNHPVHKPKGDGFEFDEEVAAIFDDMAHRSIPNYNTVHNFHANVVVDTYNRAHFENRDYVLVDVGASTGKLFAGVAQKLNLNDNEQPENFIGQAYDISDAMLARVQDKVQWVEAHNVDLTQPFSELSIEPNSVDTVSLMYTVQFIPVSKRNILFQNVYTMLRPGGTILLSQKEVMENAEINDFMENYYHAWRVQNGYTVAEISAKTQALQETMWPETQLRTMSRLSTMGFEAITETSRWMQFTSIIAVKPY